MQNQIPNNWQKVKLGDVVEFVDGDRGVNYPKNHELRDDGYCLFLNTKNIPGTGFYFSSSDNQFITKEIDERLRRGKLKRGDFILTTRGTVGNFAYYSEEIPYESIRINSGMVILRNNSNLLDPSYFRQYLNSNDFRSQVIALSSGSAQPQLPIRDLSQFLITIPSLFDQEKIASILSAFDDKIEVNNKIAKTLEDLAQALFKEWFVNFKFPGYEKVEFVDSELGKIPARWTVQNIGDICETFGGGTPSTNNETYWQDGIINWATPTDMTSLKGPFIFETEKKITDKGLKNSSTRLLPIDSILMTSRATVGILAISKISICTNQGFVAVVCNSYPSHYFMLCLLKNKLGQIRSLATGSTFPEISRGVFRKISVLLPDQDTFLKFDQIVKPIFEEIANILQENQKLSAIRDLLLPKLMKGEIRV